ncbi:hypothetical protein MP228_000302 [Amoeboaphelidium protococcarum]|nr:hypothetical protein MP228_000302 [Amoeboaphelidium protococcarum]
MVQSPRILITGALGQLGVGLTRRLKSKYQFVLPTDIRKPPTLSASGIFQNFSYLNVLDAQDLDRVVVDQRIDWIIHLSAYLSYKAELDIHSALKLNLDGVKNVFDVSVRHGVQRVFCPSTIGVYAFSAEDVAQGLAHRVADTVQQQPDTIYGISKVYMEQLGRYYRDKFGMDFRSVRLPGIISAPMERGSSVGLAGNGTTDYAIDMLNLCYGGDGSGELLRDENYDCPLSKDAELPMMYIDDCLDGIQKIMETDYSQLQNHDPVYNITGLSFTPEQLMDAIQKDRKLSNDCPSIKYGCDKIRDGIAAKWPRSLDDSRARQIWDWNPNIVSLPQLITAFKQDLAQ